MVICRVLWWLLTSWTDCCLQSTDTKAIRTNKDSWIYGEWSLPFQLVPSYLLCLCLCDRKTRKCCVVTGCKNSHLFFLNWHPTVAFCSQMGTERIGTPSTPSWGYNYRCLATLSMYSNVYFVCLQWTEPSPSPHWKRQWSNGTVWTSISSSTQEQSS